MQEARKRFDKASLLYDQVCSIIRVNQCNSYTLSNTFYMDKLFDTKWIFVYSRKNWK